MRIFLFLFRWFPSDLKFKIEAVLWRPAQYSGLLIRFVYRIRQTDKPNIYIDWSWVMIQDHWIRVFIQINLDLDLNITKFSPSGPFFLTDLNFPFSERDKLCFMTPHADFSKVPVYQKYSLEWCHADISELQSHSYNHG